MLQTGRGKSKVERPLIVHPGPYAMKYACCEGITAANAIGASPDRIRAGGSQSSAREEHGRQIMIIHTALQADRGRDSLQPAEPRERLLPGDLEPLAGRHRIERTLQDQPEVAFLGKQ